MALDFPSSPTNGQVFGNYTYDSTAGAWRSSALYSMGLPAGGTADQFLSKIDGTNYNTQWTTTLPVANGGTGLTTGSGLVPIIPTSATTGTVGATGTVTFTSQTSISVNGCFTSAYTRYRVFTDASITNMGGTNLQLNLRASGTNNTTANYSLNGYRFITWAAAQLNTTGGNAWTFIDANTNSGTSFVQAYTDFMYPQQTSRTFINHVANLRGAGTNHGSFFMAGTFDATTSFDGFTINFAVSSSGTIKIYGYN